MQYDTIQKNGPGAAAAGIGANPLKAPPAFPCAFPADVIQLQPLFFAEPDEHGEVRDAQ